MTDIVNRLRNDECSDTPDLRHEAADEIERLRSVLVEANNRWRHDFSKEVEDAADKLFKKLAAHRTDPFGHR
jgi:hypothetical protein